MSRDGKRPAFQFYPGDWLRDLALRSVSVGARGLWMDLICLMHDGQPYGHLALGGRAIPDGQVARMVGLTVEEYRPLRDELVSAGVAQVAGDGVLHSRRMVKDEHIRQVRSQAGKSGVVARQRVTAFGEAKQPGFDEAKSKQTVASADEDAEGRSKEGGVGETAVPTADYLTACCVALNTALAVRQELGGAFALVSAETQRGPDGRPIVSWERDGIPMATAQRVIADRVSRYRITPRSRQPHSLRYFDAAVREAHELASQPKGAAPPSANPFDAVIARLDQEDARAAG